MTAILRARDLTREELVELLGMLSFPEAQPVRAWLEGGDGWTLAWWRGLDGAVPWYRAHHLPEDAVVRGLLPGVLGGRIFTPMGELRWRVLPVLKGSPCRVVYLGEDLSAVAGLPMRAELDGLKAVRNSAPLWGLLTPPTRGEAGQPDEWVELRVPHRFRYPLEPFEASWKRVAVQAELESWRDDRGQVHFVRLCDLQAYRRE